MKTLVYKSKQKMSSHIDTQSIQGTLLSLLFLSIAQLFKTIEILSILQGLAYFFTIMVAIDTLTGNKIKKCIVNKFSKHDETKPKRSGPDKKV